MRAAIVKTWVVVGAVVPVGVLEWQGRLIQVQCRLVTSPRIASVTLYTVHVVCVHCLMMSRSVAIRDVNIKFFPHPDMDLKFGINRFLHSPVQLAYLLAMAEALMCGIDGITAQRGVTGKETDEMERWTGSAWYVA